MGSILNRSLHALVLVAAGSVGADAQPLGIFRWQLLPFCNVVTLNVTAQQGGIFALDGFDDQCGAGQRASIVGTAFPNPDGTVGIGLSTVLASGGAFVHTDARISPASLAGSWRDSAGNSGTLAVAPGSGTGGVVRPVSANGIAPGSVVAAQLAPGAVGANQIDSTQVQLRVTGACSTGHYVRSVNPDGTVVCEPARIPVAGSAQIHRDTPSALPADGTALTLVSLSANGSGVLVVPFPARLIAHAAVSIYRFGDPYFRCAILVDSIGTISGDSPALIATPNFGETIPIVGSADVAAGSYDVRVQCAAFGGSSSNAWEDVDLTVLAIPR